MSGHTEFLEQKLDEEIKNLNETVHALCEENTYTQMSTIQKEKELIYSISELFASDMFKRAFNEIEISALKKKSNENFYIGSSEKKLNALNKKIKNGIEKRKSIENEYLVALGINEPELTPYKNLFSSDVFLNYYFGTHII